MPADPRIVADGHAPTPFTADEIRRGCPPGRTATIRTTLGDSVEVTTTHFVTGDADGAEMRWRKADANGQVIEEAEGHSTWSELQAHASFPAPTTQISEETINSPLGELACLRYDVTGEDDITHVFWFAKDRPGMPVRFQTVVDGEVAGHSEMISDEVAS